MARNRSRQSGICAAEWTFSGMRYAITCPRLVIWISSPWWTLAAVCHTPLLLAELNPVILRKLKLERLGPATLLLRDPQLSRRMTALLNASNYPGYWFFNGERFQQFFCPTCIYTGENIREKPVASNSINIYASGNSPIAPQAPPAPEVATRFQNQLLLYRVWGHDAVSISKFRVPEF